MHLPGLDLQDDREFVDIISDLRALLIILAIITAMAMLRSKRTLD